MSGHRKNIWHSDPTTCDSGCDNFFIGAFLAALGTYVTLHAWTATKSHGNMKVKCICDRGDQTLAKKL